MNLHEITTNPALSIANLTGNDCKLHRGLLDRSPCKKVE